jgi:acyl-coenzyme A thioesterase PaaI-like protein
MKTAVTEDELKHLLATVPFTRIYGFTLASIGEGQCTISVPFQDVFERPGGIVNGAVFMAAADVAMWLAIKTQLGLADGSVTAEMKTSFLSGAKKEDFRCSARVLKCGRRLIYGVAECMNGRGELLTHHTLTYIRHHAAT